jgi:hypothetical protein
MNQTRRTKFAEKLMDWGNLTFAGLVIGQIVPGTGPFRVSMVLAGITSMGLAYAVAYYLMQGVSDE